LGKKNTQPDSFSITYSGSNTLIAEKQTKIFANHSPLWVTAPHFIVKLVKYYSENYSKNN